MSRLHRHRTGTWERQGKGLHNWGAIAKKCSEILSRTVAGTSAPTQALSTLTRRRGATSSQWNHALSHLEFPRRSLDALASRAPRPPQALSRGDRQALGRLGLGVAGTTPSRRHFHNHDATLDANGRYVAGITPLRRHFHTSGGGSQRATCVVVGTRPPTQALSLIRSVVTMPTIPTRRGNYATAQALSRP